MASTWQQSFSTQLPSNANRLELCTLLPTTEKTKKERRPGLKQPEKTLGPSADLNANTAELENLDSWDPNNSYIRKLMLTQ